MNTYGTENDDVVYDMIVDGEASIWIVGATYGSFFSELQNDVGVTDGFAVKVKENLNYFLDSYFLIIFIRFSLIYHIIFGGSKLLFQQINLILQDLLLEMELEMFSYHL